MKGYDVSHWNNIPTTLDGDFVIIKLTEGMTYRDPKAEEWTRWALDHDKRVGYYHFARPDKSNTKERAEAEARNFANAVTDMIDKFGHRPLLALDYEREPYTDKWALEWLENVQNSTAVKPVLYISQSRCNQFQKVAMKDYGLWVANWSEPYRQSKLGIGKWPFACIQQTSGGQDGMLDNDTFFGGVSAWDAYCAPCYSDETLPPCDGDLPDDSLPDPTVCDCCCCHYRNRALQDC